MKGANTRSWVVPGVGLCPVSAVLALAESALNKFEGDGGGARPALGLRIREERSTGHTGLEPPC